MQLRTSSSRLEKALKKKLKKCLTNKIKHDIIISESKKERKTKMTDKEIVKNGATKNGLEVSEIGNTLQWTMKNGQTCITWFDEKGNYTGKREWK